VAESSDGQEKTEEASSRKIQQARQKGQVPRSRELGSVLAMLLAGASFFFMGNMLVNGFSNMMIKSFAFDLRDFQDPGAMAMRFMEAVFQGLILILPFLLLMLVIGVASNLVVGGWNYATEAMAFKLEKLDPIKGMTRVFSVKGLVELLKGIAKFLFVAAVAVFWLDYHTDTLLALGREALPVALKDLSTLLLWSFIVLSASLIVVGVLDVPYQIWDHKKQLKMTKQEVKEEYKQTEGSPEIKGRQRQIAAQMARRRMMEEVPNADVVITNPTHYAVALKYDQNSMAAPLLVAKGGDLIASQIRNLASEHRVPVIQAPPLARALFYSTELNQPIPAGLYLAVAQILAYIYHLREGTLHTTQMKGDFDNLPIPDELRRDS
jgi:flagellar biosynthesis protein FlhB